MGVSMQGKEEDFRSLCYLSCSASRQQESATLALKTVKEKHLRNSNMFLINIMCLYKLMNGTPISRDNKNYYS